MPFEVSQLQTAQLRDIVSEISAKGWVCDASATPALNISYKTPIKNYTKNQAKTLIYGFCADFLSIVLLVFSISMVRILVIIAFSRLDFRNPII